MAKTTLAPQRKEPVPVQLTGKVWAPAGQASAPEGKPGETGAAARSPRLIIVLLLCLAIPLFLFFRSPSPPPEADLRPDAPPALASAPASQAPVLPSSQGEPVAASPTVVTGASPVSGTPTTSLPALPVETTVSPASAPASDVAMVPAEPAETRPASLPEATPSPPVPPPIEPPSPEPVATSVQEPPPPIVPEPVPATSSPPVAVPPDSTLTESPGTPSLRHEDAHLEVVAAPPGSLPPVPLPTTLAMAPESPVPAEQGSPTPEPAANPETAEPATPAPVPATGAAKPATPVEPARPPVRPVRQPPEATRLTARTTPAPDHAGENPVPPMEAVLPEATAPAPVESPATIPPEEPAVSAPSEILEAGPEKLVAGVPSLKKRARTLLGLRAVLQADGWSVSWVSRKDGVVCRNQTGETLVVFPGRRQAVFAGKPINAPVRPVITRSGQLFVPVELLDKILAGRLSIVERGPAGNLKIRLASTSPRSLPARELTGISYIRRQGRVLLSLRQVLEADGWTVRWENMEKGALCWKGPQTNPQAGSPPGMGADQRLVAIPAQRTLVWNDAPLKSRPPPTLRRQRLYVTLDALQTVFAGRLTLLRRNGRTREAMLRLAGG